MLTQDEKILIESIVCEQMVKFADRFKKRHIKDVKKLSGVINSKDKNVFIKALPSELKFYSALVRSYDSALGTLLEGIGFEVAGMKYKVSKKTEGKISIRQQDYINDILNSYKNGGTPDIAHYRDYNTTLFESKEINHVSDYILFDEDTNTYYIIELKSGGNLDKTKSEAQKRALLQQYFILKNITEHDVKLYFATAYNKDGEGNEWKQNFIKAFFAPEELLIGKDFWSFVCKDESGFDVVVNAYSNNIHIISQALEEIKEAYSK
ncbi:MAG: TdeIII family type II restriction endonuclease [Oscillospiraceae bacterium]|nr:TdeIII family type II restriction endonuclease [Oscillospiraceae bacterium]